MGKINRTKLLDRQSNRRDAKLFIIATEGQVTEKQYFEMFHSTRIKIEVLATGDDNKSAPEFVLKRLDEFNERYDLGEDDMFWLVFDVDRWGVRRGKLLHPNLQQKWPPSIGTHVHRLVEVILQSLN